MSFCTTSSWNLRPMRRLTANSVFCGLVTACRFADWPTTTSLSLVKATMDGVVRSPSLFSSTRGLPLSMTATQELVVPRSIPITLLMLAAPEKTDSLDDKWGMHQDDSSARGLGHHHARRPQQAAVELVARLHHLGDGAGRHRIGRLIHDRFMQGRIENRAPGLDLNLLDREFLEC